MKYNTSIKAIIRAMFLAVILTVGTSCEDFLREVPTNQLTTEADLTAREFGEPLTIGAYRLLAESTRDARASGNWLPITLEFPTGVSYTGVPHAQFDKYATKQVTGKLLDNFNKQWNNWYAVVQDANLAIQL